MHDDGRDSDSYQNHRHEGVWAAARVEAITDRKTDINLEKI